MSKNWHDEVEKKEFEISLDEQENPEELEELDDEADAEDAETLEVESSDDEPRTLVPSDKLLLDPTQIYLKEIGFTPLLTPDEEIHFGRLAQQGDEKARKRMIESNLRLVVKIARKYIHRGLPLLDLIEEGNLGLMHAVEKFDPERGFRFSTYATWWIKQTIERAMMNQTRTIRLPIHVIKELNTYLRAARALQKKLNREPTLEEIAAMVDRPVEEVRAMFNVDEPVFSYDMPIDQSDRSLLDTIDDDHATDPERIIITDDLKEKLEIWMHELDDKHREVLEQRFGLGRHAGKATFESVGENIGLSRERVRQLQMEALKELRKIMESHGLTMDIILDQESSS